MLGRHADHFMATQAREHVTAVTPNAGSTGYSPPDQERAGAPHVRMKRGMSAPSAQATVLSGALPGMGRITMPRGQRMPRGVRPAASRLAGLQPSGALPGMGRFGPSGALPGMGHYPLGRGTPGAVAGLADFTIMGYDGITVLGIAAAAWYFLKRK